MVTRLYTRQDRLGLHKSAIDLAALNWETSGYFDNSVYCGRLSTTSGTITLSFGFEANTGAANPRDVAWEAFLSDPLQAQTISGTFQGQLRAAEGGTTADSSAQMKAYVVDGAGTVLHTLYSGHALALTNELATSFTNRNFPAGGSAGVALTSYACADGDRILIIVGIRVHTLAGGTFAIDTSSVGTDLPIDNTTTTGRGWIQFSADLLFNAEVDPLVGGQEPGYLTAPVNRIGDPRAMTGEQDPEGGGSGPAEVPLTLQQWPRGNFGW